LARTLPSSPLKRRCAALCSCSALGCSLAVMSFHTRSTPTAAPNAAPVGPRSPQVQQARLLQASYFHSAAWRSGYEWRRDDALALASGATTAEADAAAAAKAPHYSWQDTATAKAFIAAQKEVEERKARTLAGENPDALTASQRRTPQPTERVQQHDLQAQPQRPPNPVARDSLDDFSASGGTRGATQQQPLDSTANLRPFHSASPFGGDSYDQQQPSVSGQPNDYQLTQYGHNGVASSATTGRSRGRRSAAAGEPVAVLAGVPVHARQFHHLEGAAAPGAVGSPNGSQAGRGGRSGAVGATRGAGSANFPLRGAGALPTHRATTRSALLRLAAQSGDATVAAHSVDPVAHPSNWDLAGWGAGVERNLASAKGTLAVQRPRTNY